MTAVRPGAVLFAPTLVRGEAVGGIFLVWWQSGRAFDAAEIRLVEGVASQLALAMENADLARQTAEKLSEMERLLNVSRALSSTIELGPLLRTLLRQVTRTTGADSAGVWLADPATGALEPFAGYHVPPDVLERLRGYRIDPGRSPVYADAIARRAVATWDSARDNERLDSGGFTTARAAPGPALRADRRERTAGRRADRRLVGARADLRRPRGRAGRGDGDSGGDGAGERPPVRGATGASSRSCPCSTSCRARSRDSWTRPSSSRPSHREVARVLDVHNLAVFLYDPGRGELEVALREWDGAREAGPPAPPPARDRAGQRGRHAARAAAHGRLRRGLRAGRCRAGSGSLGIPALARRADGRRRRGAGRPDAVGRRPSVHGGRRAPADQHRQPGGAGAPERAALRGALGGVPRAHPGPGPHGPDREAAGARRDGGGRGSRLQQPPGGHRGPGRAPAAPRARAGSRPRPRDDPPGGARRRPDGPAHPGVHPDPPDPALPPGGPPGRGPRGRGDDPAAVEGRGPEPRRRLRSGHRGGAGPVGRRAARGAARGLHQPARQRARGDARRRPSCLRAGHRGRLGDRGGPRYRRRHGARDRAAGLRAVLHDEGAAGQRARALRRVGHRDAGTAGRSRSTAAPGRGARSRCVSPSPGRCRSRRRVRRAPSHAARPASSSSTTRPASATCCATSWAGRATRCSTRRTAGPGSRSPRRSPSISS